MSVDVEKVDKQGLAVAGLLVVTPPTRLIKTSYEKHMSSGRGRPRKPTELKNATNSLSSNLKGHKQVKETDWYSQSQKLEKVIVELREKLDKVTEEKENLLE